jgi:hypothetical protein
LRRQVGNRLFEQAVVMAQLLPKQVEYVHDRSRARSAPDAPYRVCTTVLDR